MRLDAKKCTGRSIFGFVIDVFKYSVVSTVAVVGGAAVIAQITNSEEKYDLGMAAGIGATAGVAFAFSERVIDWLISFIERKLKGDDSFTSSVTTSSHLPNILTKLVAYMGVVGATGAIFEAKGSSMGAKEAIYSTLTSAGVVLSASCCVLFRNCCQNQTQTLPREPEEDQAERYRRMHEMTQSVIHSSTLN